MKHLTHKQERVLVAIKEFWQSQDRMPTRQELADILGYRSTNSIQQFLKALSNKGYVDLVDDKARGLSLERDNPSLVNIPLIGSVACGTPILAEENIEAYIPVDKKIATNDSRYFFLSANGDSMNQAGIEDGDLLLIEDKGHANPGEIILALVGDEGTVKYYKPGSDYIALVPKSTNPAHKPIILKDDFLIQGVVKKVFKQEDLDVS